jgi:hypothetical protein
MKTIYGFFFGMIIIVVMIFNLTLRKGSEPGSDSYTLQNLRVLQASAGEWYCSTDSPSMCCFDGVCGIGRLVYIP